MSVFRTIAILLLVYFVLKYLGRIFRPIMNGGSGNVQSRERNPQPDDRDEGEVRIEFTKSQEAKRKNGMSEGEYVDFEELD